MVDSSIKISVVMSVLGYEKYIVQTIESILGQTMPDLEFIIINDGCRYDLEKKVKAFRDSRIVYAENSGNAGLTRSLIKGVNMARGRYIARMDAGNTAMDRRLEMQYGFLCGSDETVLVGSSSVLIDEEGEIICLKSAVTGPGEIKKRMSLYNCIDHSTIMFRKDIPAGYREKFRYSQDYDLYLNLISRGCRIDNLPDALVRERMISGSITYSRKDEQEYYRKKAKEFFVQRQKYGMDDYDPMEECRGQEEEYAYGRSKGGFINRQKIYYLLYAGRSEKARRMIRKELSARLDPKLILYFAMSFFPLLLKKMGASRGIRYMPERDG
jgi:glycosyltransferase involved in cell wall biosynthesis